MSSIKCAWLENMISIEPDGWTRPCCGEISTKAQISRIENGFLNSFNDQKLLTLRSNLENTGYSKDTKDYCSRCEYVESKNQSSLRNNTKFLSTGRELKLIQFKLSNKCQLTCAHCGPELSSGWAKFLGITPHVQKGFKVTESLLKELASLLPQLEVIKFTGGEPFLDPDHWKILEYLSSYDRSNCTIEYITNGISPYRPELWKGWKQIKFSVSADGFEESYNWFRRGSNWDTLVSSVSKLEQHGDVFITYSITPYTIQDFTRAKLFWDKHITPIPIVYPNHASLKNFPLRVIEQLEDYKEIPYIELAQGTNIEIYKIWANNWDNKWGTQGWAKKLFYWMRDANTTNL